MKQLLNKIWRKSLPFIFLIVLAHFLKDITQDILKVPTFLDLIGNVNEDLSVFPKFIGQIIIVLGYVSYVFEAFLIVSIPKVIKGKANTRLEKYVIVTLLFLAIYFITVILMDPRYRMQNLFDFIGAI